MRKFVAGFLLGFIGGLGMQHVFAAVSQPQPSVFLKFLSRFRIVVQPGDPDSYERYADLRDKFSRVFWVQQDEQGSFIALLGVEDLDSPILHDDAFFYMVYGLGVNIAGVTEPIFFCQINGAGGFDKDFYFKDSQGEHLILSYKVENWPLKKPRSVYLEYDPVSDRLLKFE